MTVTVRLKAGLERLLRLGCRAARRTRSDFVREAIERYGRECLRRSADPASERLGDWIGALDSGRGNLSVGTGREFRALLTRRTRGRRTR